MGSVPAPVSGRIGEISWSVRPEWLAGHYWWRVFVGGHPKVLVRHEEHARTVAEALAADEQQFRREAGAAPE